MKHYEWFCDNAESRAAIWRIAAEGIGKFTVLYGILTAVRVMRIGNKLGVTFFYCKGE